METTSALTMQRLIDLDFGKMDLDRAADVVGMAAFAAAWDVKEGENVHLFIIAHELWQPAHMKILTDRLKARPGLERDREWLDQVLTAMQHGGAPNVKSNGLQSGLIAAAHGLDPLMRAYRWTKGDAPWAKLQRVADLLRTLPLQATAAGFQSVIDAMQGAKLPSMATKGAAYGVGHLARTYMRSIGAEYPPGFAFQGLKTLRSCELDALVTEACGKPGREKPWHITREQLLAFLERMTPEQAERASRERTPVTPEEERARIR
jgi:hypothetical protein